MTFATDAFLAAFGLCILLPIQALLATILVDSIPLQDPAHGWKANHGYWANWRSDPN